MKYTIVAEEQLLSRLRQLDDRQLRDVINYTIGWMSANRNKEIYYEFLRALENAMK